MNSMPSFLQNLPYNIEDSWGIVKRGGRKLEGIEEQEDYLQNNFASHPINKKDLLQ